MLPYPKLPACQTLLPAVTIPQGLKVAAIPRRTMANGQVASTLEDLFLEDLTLLIEEATADGAHDFAALAGSELLSAVRRSEWLAHLRVVDAWRLHNPTSLIFSGPKRTAGRANRLDYVLIDGDIVAQHYKTATYFESTTAGDHLCHTVTLGPSAARRGKGYWKLPRELLLDADVRASILSEARELLPKLRASDNPGVVWAGWTKRTRRHECGEISSADLARERAMYTTTLSDQRRAARDQMFDFHCQEIERSSSAFFSKPASRLHHVPITTAVTDRGQRTNDPAEIAEAFTTHWCQVMTNTNDHVPTRAQSRRLTQLLDRRLNDDQRAALRAPLTVAEFSSAIRTMRSSGSPGMDGLPAAFFQLDAALFGELLHIVHHAQLDRGVLLHHHRQSAVTLLFKGGDRALPGSYRPITLMSVELKILARVLARRLGSLLPSLIHPMQSGFAKGRCIHDNICLVQSLQAHVSADADSEGYATFLDFSKAFDRVEWRFLFDCMDQCGLPPEFTRWIQLLYTDPVVFLFLNGHRAPPLRPNRGVKQGCPLSALLFVLTIEPLGQLLRSQPGFGIALPTGGWSCGALFADDVTLFSGSRPSLEG
ncbi:hypothetical protein ACHHYP_20797 [Achlya hypogyna]|uniref:Reverse transcriptase domain-containing protein n=1 Tax=Achlya hypogyna TaxID=1202772 RepID=A0A1V9Y9I6_ACHHY|nr:hypothetical protein ACHHYP_20797 [Achlya hypogyna]